MRLLLPFLAATLVACTPSSSRPVGGQSAVPFEPAGAPTHLAMASLLAPPAPLDASRQALLDRVLADPQAFFANGPSTEVLNETELVFFAAGRSFELADLYLEQVEREAAAGPTQVRLAWLYQRLGLRDAALRLAGTALDARPDDPAAQFVDAFVKGQQAPLEPSDVEAVRRGYERVLILDPQFRGPGGVTAADLREQVSAIAAAAE
jgi:tetratricopeptide (TPR) repeat protein